MIIQTDELINDRIQERGVMMAINDVECCDFYQVHEDVVKAVNEKMPDEDELCDLAEIFKVFGDSTRIKNRLVKSRREGKAVFYSLADGHVRTIINQGLEHIQE